MRRRFVALLALGWSLSAMDRLPAEDPKGDAVKTALKRFQGSWLTVKIIADGQDFSPGVAKGAERGKGKQDDNTDEDIEIYDGDKCTLVRNNQKFTESVITIDPKKNTIDASHVSGPFKGRTFQGIYKLEGDTLSFCYAIEKGKERPTTFECKAGSGTALIVLKRQKP
jgi:uncharacterized protein (TIGR03067 family)